MSSLSRSISELSLISDISYSSKCSNSTKSSRTSTCSKSPSTSCISSLSQPHVRQSRAQFATKTAGVYSANNYAIKPQYRTKNSAKRLPKLDIKHKSKQPSKSHKNAWESGPNQRTKIVHEKINLRNHQNGKHIQDKAKDRQKKDNKSDTGSVRSVKSTSSTQKSTKVQDKQDGRKDAQRRELYHAFRLCHENTVEVSTIVRFLREYKAVNRTRLDVQTITELEALLKETLQAFDNKSKSQLNPPDAPFPSVLQKSVREYLVRPVVWRCLGRLVRSNMVKTYNTTIDRWFYGDGYSPPQVAESDGKILREKQHDNMQTISDCESTTSNGSTSDQCSTQSSDIMSEGSDVTSFLSDDLAENEDVSMTTSSGDSSDGETSSDSSDSDSESSDSSTTSDATLTMSNDDTNTFHSFSSSDLDLDGASSTNGSVNSQPEDTLSESSESLDEYLSSTAEDEQGAEPIKARSKSPISDKVKTAPGPLKNTRNTKQDRTLDISQKTERPKRRTKALAPGEVQEMVSKVHDILQFYNVVQQQLYRRELAKLADDNSRTPQQRRWGEVVNNALQREREGSSQGPDASSAVGSTNERPDDNNQSKNQSAPKKSNNEKLLKNRRKVQDDISNSVGQSHSPTQGTRDKGDRPVTEEPRSPRPTTKPTFPDLNKYDMSKTRMKRVYNAD